MRVHTYDVWHSSRVDDTSHNAAVQLLSEEAREDVSEKKQTSHMLFVCLLQNTVLVCMPFIHSDSQPLSSSLLYCGQTDGSLSHQKGGLWSHWSLGTLWGICVVAAVVV